MEINPFFIHFPPFISTSWYNVAALHMRGGALVFTLIEGEAIVVPGLPPHTLDLIFKSHATFLKKESKESEFKRIESREFPGEAGVRFGVSAFDPFGMALQHTPAQANSPNLPLEMLEKITQITKILSPEENDSLPQPEAQCNCPFCQIAHALHGSHPLQTQKLEVDEPVKDEELTFKEWEVAQAGPNLYLVTHPLNANEKYNVYLGDKVGCTCGSEQCDHIAAVLKSYA